MSQSSAHRPILVAGATGAVGREVVRALLERGACIRVFVRSAERVKDLPEGVERAVGDLNSGQTVARALDGVGAAFFVPPHDEAEEQITRIFVVVCERAGVRLVFSGVHADGPTRLQRLGLRAVNGLLFPQFPRVDTRDVGDGAANVLLDPAVEPSVYWMVGQASMGGEQIAANWSAALKRDVRYVPDLPVSNQMFATHFSGKKATDYHKTQELIAKIPCLRRPPICAGGRHCCAGRCAATPTTRGRPPRDGGSRPRPDRLARKFASSHGGRRT